MANVGDGVVRLGIVGFGRQGSVYADLITRGEVPGMVLAGIADIATEPLARAEQAYPEVARFDSVTSMAKAVDAVVITVPHYSHVEVAIAALDGGVHVLVDKPVAVEARQVEELLSRSAASPELLLAIMYNQRTNPVMARAREIVRAGEIGEIRRSSWTVTNWWRPQSYFDHDTWRASWGGEGGGVLVNQAVHQLDLWQWICGMPVVVQAKLGLGVGRDISVETEVAVLAEYANGGAGTFITATNDLLGTDHLEIVGTRGRIVIEGSERAVVTRLAREEPSILVEHLGPTPEIGAGAVLPDELVDVEVVEMGSVRAMQHAGILANFADAILNGAELIAPGVDGLNEVRLANAIHLAGWTGQPVRTEVDTEEFRDALNKQIREEGRFAER